MPVEFFLKPNFHNHILLIFIWTKSLLELEGPWLLDELISVYGINQAKVYVFLFLTQLQESVHNLNMMI